MFRHSQSSDFVSLFSFFMRHHFCRRLEVHNEQLLDQVTFPSRCVLLRNAVQQDYVRSTAPLMLEAEG